MKSKEADDIIPKRSDEEMLNELQRQTFTYFIKGVNSQTGLIADKTRPGFPSSIAATGMGLSCYIVGVERGLMTRTEAVKRTLTVLKFFSDTDPHTSNSIKTTIAANGSVILKRTPMMISFLLAHSPFQHAFGSAYVRTVCQFYS